MGQAAASKPHPEDRFARHPQDAGDRGPVERLRVLVLKSAAEPTAHEVDHLLVIALLPGFDDRRIVLVDQHHDRLAVKNMQVGDQILEGKLQCRIIRAPQTNSIETDLLLRLQAVSDRLMFPVERRKLVLNRRMRFCPGVPLNVL
jgi:hypothetical protein